MNDNKGKKKTILTGVIGTIFLVGLIMATSFISIQNNLNKREVVIDRLDNDITIEQEEIVSIQEELKIMVQDYTDYERESNELVVENLDPQFVVNMYPELRSSRMYDRLNRQYLSSMRKIKDAKSRYNTAVEEYNSYLVTFTGRTFFGDKEQKEFLK